MNDKSVPLHKVETVFETKSDDWHNAVQRMRVAGGYIYSYSTGTLQGVAVSTTFVPDEKP